MPQFGRKIDVRDGRKYRTVLIGSDWWLAENLAWDGGTNYPPNGDLGNVAKHGRLYSGAISSVAIPGTREPTPTDQANLYTASGGASIAGLRLKTSEYGGNNLSGFSWLCSGLRDPSGVFLGFDSLACFAVSGSNYAYSFSGDDFAGGEGSGTGTAFPVRLIVTEGNIPDGPEILGIPFAGLERGYSVSIDRHVNAKESLGGSVRLIPQAPADSDIWTVDAEVWLNAEQALAFEAAAGAYGSDTAAEIRLPPRNGASSFPGLMPATQNAAYDTYLITSMRNPESLGRKGVRQDLIGYRLSFDLIGKDQSGVTVNNAIALSATVPAWLPKKFAAHQIQDASEWTNYASTTTGGAVHRPAKVKHGRRRDHNILIDHIDSAQADELMAWYRNSRNAPVTITIDRGPSGMGAVSVYLVGLDLQAGAGLWWDGTLEVVEA